MRYRVRLFLLAAVLEKPAVDELLVLEVAGDLGDRRAGVGSQGDQRLLGELVLSIEGADGFTLVSLLGDKGLLHGFA